MARAARGKLQEVQARSPLLAPGSRAVGFQASGGRGTLSFLFAGMGVG